MTSGTYLWTAVGFLVVGVICYLAGAGLVFFNSLFALLFFVLWLKEKAAKRSKLKVTTKSPER
jgi:hypothetical protein